MVDSDSEDNTVTIAKNLGAKVVNESLRGYGNAIRKGFLAAKGSYVIMYDPDGSYDASTIPLIVRRLREGYDYVNGNRFCNLTKKSMSLSHYIGNIIINWMGWAFFRVNSRDMLSGYKGFRRSAMKKMDLRAQKWDLNVEIHSKVRSNNLKFKEIPTTYFLRVGKSKLSATTAAWNNFRFMLLRSPNFVFIYPSVILMTMGVFSIIYNFMSTTLGNVSLIFSTMIFFIGFQMLLFGLVSKTAMYKKGFENRSMLSYLGSKLTLEKGIAASGILFSISFIIFLFLLVKWLRMERTLMLTDIKLGIISFTVFISSVSMLYYSFMNEMLNE